MKMIRTARVEAFAHGGREIEAARQMPVQRVCFAPRLANLPAPEASKRA
jgi:hypothetical protein